MHCSILYLSLPCSVGVVFATEGVVFIKVGVAFATEGVVFIKAGVVFATEGVVFIKVGVAFLLGRSLFNILSTDSLCSYFSNTLSIDALATPCLLRLHNYYTQYGGS